MIRKIIILSLVIFFSFGAKAQENKKERDRLLRGAVVIDNEKDPQTKDRITIGKVVFPAPLETSWQVITDYGSYPTFLSNIRALKIEKRDGNLVWLQLQLKNLWPLPDHNLQVLMEEVKEQGIIKFRMTQGDFESYYGSWKLISLDPARTLAEYHFFQYVGWWWFPFMPNLLANNSLVSEQLKEFQKRIRDFQIESSLEPEKVIKPFWRKSIFKEREKPEPKTPSRPEEQKNEQEKK